MTCRSSRIDRSRRDASGFRSLRPDPTITSMINEAPGAAASNAQRLSGRQQALVVALVFAGAILSIVGLVIGLNMALKRTVVHCANGTYFPEGTTDFRCFGHLHAGEGTAIALPSSSRRCQQVLRRPFPGKGSEQKRTDRICRSTEQSCPSRAACLATILCATLRPSGYRHKIEVAARLPVRTASSQQGRPASEATNIGRGQRALLPMSGGLRFAPARVATARG
jgi:hypothetical protein